MFYKQGCSGDLVSPLARLREPFGRQRTAAVNTGGWLPRQDSVNGYGAGIE
jgi:hypothetical protein